MSIFLGIDIGTVSIKIVVLCEDVTENVLSNISTSNNIFYRTLLKNKIATNDPLNLFVTECFPVNGNPIQETSGLVRKILKIIPKDQIRGVRVCGSGGRLIGDILGINNENEFRAIASGVSKMYPEIQTIFEMGGQNSKFISLEIDSETGSTGISDYQMSGDCAAGTGSFLDQQAYRLKYDINEIGDIVSGTEKSAKIAGRCSVFAKSDMIHAQQKGFKPEEVLKGLCEAVARNFKSSIIKSKKIKTPVLFIGGVAKNTGVVDAVKQVFNFTSDELLVPDYYAWMPAIGTAFAERNAAEQSGMSYF